MPIVYGLTSQGVAVPVQVDSDGKVVMSGGAAVPNILLDGSVHSDTVNGAPGAGYGIQSVDQGGGSYKWQRVINIDHIPGEVIMYGSATIPTGWLECDGSAVSRSTYAALFAIIGTTWGAGDGSTTFNVPNLKGRAPVGRGTGSGLTARTLAAIGGEETHVLTDAEMPSHNHTIDARQTSGAVGTNVLIAGNAATNTTRTTNTAGSDAAHENMMPFIVLTFMIKT